MKVLHNDYWKEAFVRTRACLNNSPPRLGICALCTGLAMEGGGCAWIYTSPKWEWDEEDVALREKPKVYENN